MNFSKTLLMSWLEWQIKVFVCAMLANFNTPLQWNLCNTNTTRTLPNCPYYSGVLSSEVGHSFESHTHQLARLTFITEALRIAKEGPT